LLSIVGDRKNLAPQLQAPLEHARRIVTAADESRVERLSGLLDAVLARFPDEDFERVRAYAEHLAGRRKIYRHEPTAGHFPFLPALEFFPRSLTPWFDRLESATDAVRAELISLWQDEDGFRPYVRFDASEPVNQWAELNHSPKWSAFFLLEDGQRVESNLARCPDTARLLDTLPMLDIPGKSPTAMFSILKPKTRIPAHTGSSNVRSTVHLPLVVPEGCGFRVGATTRPWRVGEAWAFDDTIEHEAWNNSDQPRAVLILDIWNPLLSGAEREAVRVLG
jgi:aspartyl/asparaginyl beta-hydroxylase (cupin superfamily)